MAEFEDKLNAILSNPALMGQILSMADSLGTAPSPSPPPPPPSPSPVPPAYPPGAMAGGLDSNALQGMMQMLQATQIDPREQNLVRALEGFLPPDRLQKLVKAMQAAKVAKFASHALGEGR